MCALAMQDLTKEVHSKSDCIAGIAVALPKVILCRMFGLLGISVMVMLLKHKFPC